MKHYLLFFLLAFANLLHAQGQSSTTPLHFTPTSTAWQTPSYPIELEEVDPFLAYTIAWQGTDDKLRVRFSANGIAWTDWEDCQRDWHEIEGDEYKYTIVAFADKNARFFQVQSQGQVNQATFHTYNPEASPRLEASTPTEGTNRICPCPLPDFQAREDWCPNGTCPEHANPAFTQVSHIIVHHTATSNSSSDWAAVVRSIWNTHVNVRGWSDIGYNWLIAPDGVIYQGRKNDWIGAHFCSANTNTMGIAMLGTFTTQSPAPTAIQSLRALAAWKACESDIDPLGEAFHPPTGLTLKHISGHQDGCPTECPGSTFYPSFANLRQEIQDYLTDNCSSDPTSTTPLFSDFNIRLSPNPTIRSTTIMIEAPIGGPLNVQLYNTASQALFSLQTSLIEGHLHQIPLEVNHLPKGIYWVYLKHERGEGIFKLLKL